MPTKIESTGTFIGTIIESGFDMTKNGVPQWVARLQATKKYIESKEEIEWFQANRKVLQDGKADWVDWSEFDEDIVAYMTLYKTGGYDKADESLNAKQLNIATGWQAPNFDQFGELTGKAILFRVAFDSYTSPEGKLTEGNKVSWIDSETAAPQRQLRTLDPTAIKDAMAKFTGYGKQKTAASAAPTKPPTPAVGSAPSAPQARPGGKGAGAPPKPKATPPVTGAGAATATPPTVPPTASLPANATQMEAWDYIQSIKGNIPDADVEKSWMEAAKQVLGLLDEAKATTADWAAVRDLVVASIERALAV